jgi:hypothetical protein
MQLLHDPSEINGVNLNNIRSEASRLFTNKKGEYLKHKINELAMNSKNKNIRDSCKGINQFKWGYQPKNNLVNDENGDLLADSGHSCLEVEIYIAKLKKYKSPGSYQIPAQLIQVGREILLYVIHKLINSIWNKEELPDQWKELIIALLHKKSDKIVIITMGHHCYQLQTKFCRIFFFQQYYILASCCTVSFNGFCRLCCRLRAALRFQGFFQYIDEIIGDHRCGFQCTDQLLIRYSAIARYWRKNGSTMRQYISYS